MRSCLLFALFSCAVFAQQFDVEAPKPAPAIPPQNFLDSPAPSTAPAPKRNAEEVEIPPKRSTLWKISALFAAAATVADTHSSWGRLEINPMLRSTNGRFGLRGVSVKALVTGGSIGAQYILLRRNPKAEKYGIITNFAIAGVLGTAAAANYRLNAERE